MLRAAKTQPNTNTKITPKRMEKSFTDMVLALGEMTYLRPAIILFAGLIVGYFMQKLIVRAIRKMAEKTQWKEDDVVIKSLGKAPLLWILLLSLYFGIFDMPYLQGYREQTWQFILIVLITSFAVIGSRVAVGFIDLYASREERSIGSTSMFSLITQLSIFTIAALVVLQTVGISVLPLLTALGVGGVAIALALQETLANLFAGLHIIASRKVRLGDMIEIDEDRKGFIEDISWRSTTIRTWDNTMVIIPNSTLASSIVTNYCRPQKQISILVPVTVAYGSDIEKVKKISMEIAIQAIKEVPGGIADSEPSLSFYELGPSGVNYYIVLEVKDYSSQFEVRDFCLQEVHRRFQEEGIILPVQEHNIHLMNNTLKQNS